MKTFHTTYPSYTFVSVPSLGVPLEDWEELLCMSCCDHHIISNSTFSWWGAYVNPSIEKMVCYPLSWFGTSTLSHKQTKDICPMSWSSY
jgi:hypothetical protein